MSDRICVGEHDGGHAAARALAAHVVPYVPDLLVECARANRGTPPYVHSFEGTMVFGDVSGFTKLSERLARHGKVGAEEIAGAINGCFAELLAAAHDLGGSLLKFGGDALLLAFTGDGHEGRASLAALEMRARLRNGGALVTTAGKAQLRISIGIHSDTFRAIVVGSSHHELVLVGPEITAIVEAEATAKAGEIVVTPSVAAALQVECLRSSGDERLVLARSPGRVPNWSATPIDAGDLDLSRYVPRAVRNHLTDGGGDAEHREATIAFIHFDGTDELIRQEGVHATAKRLHALLESIQRAADSQSITFLGTDVDRDGGKVILAAGVPRRFGDDETRMLTALRMVFDDAQALPLRCGVHVGPVFAGDIGPLYRRTYTVMGDTVNLSARLMAAAAPGQILASPEVLDRSRVAFVTQTLPSFEVKGKRKPVEAVVVGASKRLTSSTKSLLPFTGRDDVVGEFDGALDEGRNHVFEIVGAAGFGKSRVIDEMRWRASDLVSFVVTCQLPDRDNPYIAVRTLVDAALRISSDVPNRASVIIGCIARSQHVDDDQLALLSTALNLGIPDTTVTELLEPQFRKMRVDAVVAGCLDEILPSSSFIAIDDGQNLDAESAACLERLMALTEKQRILCVAATDDSRAFSWSGSAAVHRCHLDVLTTTEAEALLVQATEGYHVMPSTIRRVVAQAGGHPLFLSVLATRLRDGTPPSELPHSIEGVVTASIDRLPRSGRDLLRRAAIFGGSFEVSDLCLIYDHSPGEVRALARELGEYLIEESHDRWRFRNAITREVAYEALPYRIRRDLHDRVATHQLRRGLAPNDVGALAEAAHHLFHCQRYDDAWQHARSAGDAARREYSNEEAESLLIRSLAAGKRVAGVPATELAAVWESLGDIRECVGKFEEALSAYRAALRHLRDSPVNRARVLLRMAWIPERLGNYSGAVRYIRRAERELAGADTPETQRVRADLLAAYGAMRQAQGRVPEAIQACHDAIGLARTFDAPRAEAHASLVLDWAFAALGAWEKATHSERALSIYSELRDLGGRAAVLQNLGAYAYYQGRFGDAVAYYSEAREVRASTGNDVDAAMLTCNIGEVLIEQGRYEQAHCELVEALRLCRTARFQYGAAFAAMLMGRISLHRGSLREARGLLEECRAAFRAAGLAADAATATARLAEWFLCSHLPDDALRLLSEELCASQVAARGPDAALIERLAGYAYLQQGNRKAARASFENSLEAAQARDAAFEIGLTTAALARSCAREQAFDEAARFAGESEVILERLGVESLPYVPLG